MTTIFDSLTPLGLGDDARGDRCIARIARKTDPTTGKVRSSVLHATLDECGDRDVEQLEDAYFTTALYRKGAINPKGGRTTENAVAIQELMFDADLKDYLGRPAAELHDLPQEEIDGYIASLVKDAQDVFKLAGIPVHRIVYTGYGIALYIRLESADQGRLDFLSHIHKTCVQRINALFGGVLVDPAVSDPATRFTRIPGTYNTKGGEPRHVRVIAEYPGSASLDDFDIDTEPVVTSLPRASSPQTLSNEALDEIVLALVRCYDEGKRNSIALGIPAMLVKAGVSEEQCLTVVERVAADDEEIDNRLDAVRRTYARYERGLSVAGYRSLVNWLPTSVTDLIKIHLRKYQQEVTVTVGGTKKEVPIETAASDVSPLRPFPDSCYYGWFGAYRDLMASCTSAADQFHLAASLVYAGATLGKRASIYQAEHHYPNLMAVLVGETGDAKKDTAANLARRFFEGQETAREREMTITPYNILYGLSTTEGLLQDMATAGANVVVHSSEFAILIGKGRRETSGSLLMTLTRLWDAPDQIDLPTRKDPIRVQDPVLSLIGTVTPGQLVREMKPEDIESGFANRLLWVHGVGKGYLEDPPKPDALEKQRLLTEFLDATDHAIQQSPEFRKDRQAKELWSEWARGIHYAKYQNEDERHMAERIEANAARIAVLFAATDGTPIISLDHLQAAIDFVMTSFNNVRISSALWGANDELQIEAMIMNALRQGPLGYAALRRYCGKFDAVSFKRVFEACREMELLKPDSDGLLRVA
jgi:hypothetical protein